MRTYLTFALSILLATSAFAAPASPAGSPVSAVDSDGRTIALPAPARRIVSLSPGITETLFAIGAGDRLVGRTSYCDYPEAAKSLPEVGGFSAKTISVELIVSLAPDLVISSGRIHAEIEGALVRLGIPVFHYAPPGLADIAAQMRALGRLAGVEARAAAAADNLLAELAAIEKVIAKVRPADRPSVFWEIYDEPLMTAGAATFQHAIVEAAGGRDIFSDLSGSWPRVSAEDVIARAPAWILGADDHGDKMSVAMIASRPGWSLVPAVRDGRVALIPAAIVSRPSPRIAQGVRAVAKILYPELFR